LMICAMLSYSFYVLLTRKMGKTETAESLIFYSALAPALLMLPVALPMAQMPPTALSWVLLLSLGVFGGLGHWFVILAYKRASTAALAPYPYSQMLWMVLSGWLFFGQLPDGWTVIGAAIIIGSGLYIAFREHVLRKAVSVGAQRL
jgi:drug/metabolite transporter (DMT)-like permease